MAIGAETITNQVETALKELAEKATLNEHKLLVVGCSTSEVIGKNIGTSGAIEVAEAIYRGVIRVQAMYSFTPVFQCCEHLNRALVIEQSWADRLNLTVVSAVPAPHAGGSMASCAYRQLRNPCLVEEISAHAGIDIGDTLIGMHIKAVAVPFRSSSITSIGEAHVTMAYSRPKLIGGIRAVYE